MDLSGLEFGDGRLGKVAKLLFFCFFFMLMPCLVLKCRVSMQSLGKVRARLGFHLSQDAFL